MDSWFQNSHEEYGQLQTSSGKSKDLKLNWLPLPKKYIPLAKTKSLGHSSRETSPLLKNISFV